MARTKTVVEKQITGAELERKKKAVVDAVKRLESVLKAAQATLNSATIAGGDWTVTGVGFSYGIAEDMGSAEEGLHADKKAREAAEKQTSTIKEAVEKARKDFDEAVKKFSSFVSGSALSKSITGKMCDVYKEVFEMYHCLESNEVIYVDIVSGLLNLKENLEIRDVSGACVIGVDSSDDSHPLKIEFPGEGDYNWPTADLDVVYTFRVGKA